MRFLRRFTVWILTPLILLGWVVYTQLPAVDNSPPTDDPLFAGVLEPLAEESLPVYGPELPSNPLPPFPLGEVLHYEVNAGLGSGSAWIITKKEEWNGIPAWRLHGLAKGGVLGFNAKIVVDSWQAEEDLRLLHYSFHQTGSDLKDTELRIVQSNPKPVQEPAVARDFESAVVEYWKKKDRDEGRVWEKRFIHQTPAGETGYDPFAALYHARMLPWQSDTPGKIRLVNGRDVWDVEIKKEGEERIEVEGKTYDTWRVSVIPHPVNDHAKEDEFEGLFGVKGDIRIWVDKETRIPVQVTGTVPIGISMRVTVRLKSRSFVKE